MSSHCDYVSFDVSMTFIYTMHCSSFYCGLKIKHFSIRKLQLIKNIKGCIQSIVHVALNKKHILNCTV